MHIGCGRNLFAGWLNTDIAPVHGDAAYLDATRRFPFADDTFDCVFNEHIIEHVPFECGQVLLRESLRVLKPGGKIRISTPNLRNIASLISDTESEVRRNYIEVVSKKYVPANTARLAGFVVNNFYWDFGHYFVYDPDTLRFALTQAGFSNIVECELGVSSTPALDRLETHGGVVGDEINRFESMVFEAAKPV